MIRIRNIKISILDDNENHILNKISNILKINKDKILDYKIIKKSLDARNKSNILYIYTIDIKLENENIIKKINNKDIFIAPNLEYKFNISGKLEMKYRPIIVGEGPSGLFVAYILAKNNYKPIIFERGKSIESRVKDINLFWKTGKLDINSNVQFGEGGAGTFSDGKLNTLVKDELNRSRFIFETFVECGAPKEILYDYHPHIGTDILRKVIINLRNKIISLGGEVYHNSCLTDIIIKNLKITGIIINNTNKYPCDNLFLCLGHSARDTYHMLNNHKINMMPKPFSIGLRIMHSQELIDKSMYGASYKLLDHASYKLTYQTKDSRGVYSFCMCPGGYVINASSEKNMLAINGMSDYKRDSNISNSALVVTVSPLDYGTNLFDGLEFQRRLERKAFNICNGKIPIQTYKDFLYNIKTEDLSKIKIAIKGKYEGANLNEILPDYISNSIKEAMPYFNSKIDNFATDDAVLAGIESRTSSPIRITRNDFFESNIEGIYPVGEGAGYAGGITTSAIDGLKSAEHFANKYKPFN